MWSAIPRRIARHRLELLAGLRVAGRPARRRRGAAAAGAEPAPEPGLWARGGGAGRRLGGARLDEREDVLLRHAAAPSGAGHGLRVDPVLGGDARHDGRDERVLVVVAVPARRAASPAAATRSRRRRRSRPPPRRRSPAARRASSSAASSAGGRSSAGGAAAGALWRDDRDARPDGDRLALLDEDLLDDARARARDLRVDLVGGDLEQRLVGLDRLALALDPADDRPLGDGHAHLGHHDVDRRSRSPSSSRPARSVRSPRRRPAG